MLGLVAIDLVEQRAELGGEVAVAPHLDLFESVDVIGNERPEVYGHVHQLGKKIVSVGVILLQLSVKGFNKPLLMSLYWFAVY